MADQGFDITRWVRLEREGLPIWVCPTKPDWFVPNRAGDRLLRELADGGRATQPPEHLFLSRLPPAAEAPSLQPPAELGLDRLRELWLHLTDRCNQTCGHCLFACSPNARRDLLGERIEQLVGEAAALGCKVLVFTGGEPFLHPAFVSLVDFVLERSDAHLAVLTNGTLLTKYGGAIQRWGPVRFHLQVSLDGLPKAHDRIRGRGAFGRLDQQLSWLRQTRIPYALSVCVNESNLADLPDLIDLAADRQASGLHLMWYIVRGRGARAGYVEPRRIFDSVVRAAERAEARGVEIDNIQAIRAQVFAPPGTRQWGSSLGFESLTVGPDGRLYPAPSLVGVEELASEVGPDLERSWRDSPVFNRLRAGLRRASDSPLRLLLGAGDPDLGYLHTGEWGGADPYWPLYEELALWCIARAAGDHPADGPPGLRLKMGEILVRCGSYGRDVLTHGNCLQSLWTPGSREVVAALYTQAAAKPKGDIANPVCYPESLVAHVPAFARVRSYGCGSPVLDAELKPGERVVDLGSGSGVECFIASKLVGDAGGVVGVDMLDEMLAIAERARGEVAAALGYANVAFVRGTLEQLPLDAGSADAVISNCVLNLSADKRRTFAEIFRVLRPGGRLVVSDVVADDEPDPSIRSDERLRGECIAGALTARDLTGLLRETGFVAVRVMRRFAYREVRGQPFFSLTFQAQKPIPVDAYTAIYRGPFAAAVTSDGRLAVAGQPVELSDEALADWPEQVLRVDARGAVTNAPMQNTCCAPADDAAGAPDPGAHTRQPQACCAADAAGSTVERRAADCAVCGAPLVYQPVATPRQCAMCGQRELTEACCREGHFVCDRCHSADALQAIERGLLASRETDLIALFAKVRAHPTFAVHGPEHHALVPAVIVAGYRNAGGELDDQAVGTAIQRGAKVAGGFCGLMGTCGAAVGVGIAFSVILGANPLDASGRHKAQQASFGALRSIAELEAARCCQRDGVIALKKAAELSTELLGVRLEAEAPLVCTQMAHNRECLGKACLLWPVKAVPALIDQG